MAERWRVYKQRDGFWAGYWIAQPPGASFDDSYCFVGQNLRGFDYALNFATQQAATERDHG